MKRFNAFFYSILILSIFILCAKATAELPSEASNLNNYTFIKYDTNLGLGDNIVDSLYVDPKETIYAGTQGGLSIMEKNASHFTNYDASLGLGNNYVTSVFVDSKETIYAGTIHGLSIMEKGAKGFTNYDKNSTLGLHTNSIYSVYGDENGIYLGTPHGLSIMETGAKDFKNHRLGAWTKSDIVYSVYTANGVIYVGMPNGVAIVTKDSQKQRHYHFKYFDTNANTWSSNNSYVHSVFVDASGVIYAGTAQGLFIMEKSAKSFTNYDMNSGLGSNLVNSVYVDANGIIYVGTDDGLSIGEKNTHGYQFRNYYITSHGSINKNKETHISYFLSRERKDIAIISVAPDSINKEVDTRSENIIHSVYVNASGILYLGTQDGVFIGKKDISKEPVTNTVNPRRN